MSYFGIPIRNGASVGLGSIISLLSGRRSAPSLSLNFLSGSLDSQITFTRASTGTYFDSAGVLQTAAINAPRFDYDPSTLAAQGLLIEEARTNSIRNNTMVGAVAGTPGTPPTNWTGTNVANGISREIVAIGVENGINYIDIRFFGTASATGNHAITTETSTQIAAVSGQSWTGSAYVRLIAGSLANLVVTNRVNGRDAAGVLLESVGSVTLTPTSAALRTQRAISTGTLANALSVFVTQQVVCAYNSGAVVDITLRIGLPQLELGAFATSAIPTTTAAATRAQDFASVNTLTPWYNATQGTLYASYSPSATGLICGAAALSDGTQLNRMIIRAMTVANQTLSLAVDVNVSQWALSFTGATTATTKSVLGYKPNDIAFTRNGASALTDAAATIPVVNRLVLGGDGDGSFALNGYLQSVIYYPSRLSNAQLRALTV